MGDYPPRLAWCPNCPGARRLVRRRLPAGEPACSPLCREPVFVDETLVPHDGRTCRGVSATRVGRLAGFQWEHLVALTAARRTARERLGRESVDASAGVGHVAELER